MQSWKQAHQAVLTRLTQVRRHVKDHVAASVDLLVDFVYMLIHIAMILLRSRD